MTLIQDLQRQLTSSGCDLSTSLRMMMVLSAEISSASLGEWAARELKGYPEASELPSYRVLPAAPMGVFAGVAGHREIRALPQTWIDESIRTRVTTLRFSEPVAQLASFARADGQSVRWEWPQEWVIASATRFQISNGLKLIGAYSTVESAHLDGMFDSIRTHALEFVIELRRVRPEVVKSDEALSRVTPEEARQILNITMSGGTAIIAAGHTVTQNATSHTAIGDLEALRSALRAAKIDESDISDLDAALNSDPKPVKRALGTAVSGWLGRMITKAAAGALSIPPDTAAALLANAIWSYYGPPSE